MAVAPTPIGLKLSLEPNIAAASTPKQGELAHSQIQWQERAAGYTASIKAKGGQGLTPAISQRRSMGASVQMRGNGAAASATTKPRISKETKQISRLNIASDANPVTIVKPATSSNSIRPNTASIGKSTQSFPGPINRVDQALRELEDFLSFKTENELVHDNSISLLDLDIPTSFSSFGLLLPTILADQEDSQRQNEVARRPFHSTLQKSSTPLTQENYEAPPALLPVEKLAQDFLDGVEQAIISAFQGICAYTGHVRVEVELGRIYLNGIHTDELGNDNRLCNMPVPEMADFLTNLKVSKEANFTKILSTSAGDLQYVIDLKDQQGERLFQPMVTKWHVVYEMLFREKKGEVIVVEIDAENSSSMVKKLDRLLGVIFVHCPSRNWDAIVSASGSEMTKGYDDFVEAIVSSLSIL